MFEFTMCRSLGHALVGQNIKYKAMQPLTAKINQQLTFKENNRNITYKTFSTNVLILALNDQLWHWEML